LGSFALRVSCLTLDRHTHLTAKSAVFPLTTEIALARMGLGLRPDRMTLAARDYPARGTIPRRSPMTATIPRILAPKPTQGKAPSHSPPDTRYVPGNALARFLGYFSIGLGLMEVLFPRTMSGITGVGQVGLIPAYGAREIVTGIGILSSSRPTAWLWARVAGDALDLATLGENLAAGNGEQRHRALLATAAVVGVTVLDMVCAGQLSAAAALTDD
jgi:hypothetical protein